MNLYCKGDVHSEEHQTRLFRGGHTYTIIETLVVSDGDKHRVRDDMGHTRALSPGFWPKYFDLVGDSNPEDDWERAMGIL